MVLAVARPAAKRLANVRLKPRIHLPSFRYYSSAVRHPPDPSIPCLYSPSSSTALQKHTQQSPIQKQSSLSRSTSNKKSHEPSTSSSVSTLAHLSSSPAVRAAMSGTRRDASTSTSQLAWPSTPSGTPTPSSYNAWQNRPASSRILRTCFIIPGQRSSRSCSFALLSVREGWDSLLVPIRPLRMGCLTAPKYSSPTLVRKRTKARSRSLVKSGRSAGPQSIHDRGPTPNATSSV